MLFSETMGRQDCCFDLESEQESDLTMTKEWEPMDWEIREWYAELRENDVKMQSRKAKEEEGAEEKCKREQDIIERENQLAARQRELEAKELELEEKAALLEIAIRGNKLSIETRFGRLEELQIASKLRRTQNMQIKRGSREKED